jgi:hypothetical protein
LVRVVLVLVEVVEPLRADRLASGWRSLNPAGSGTPSTSWRSTHTLATDRAAAVSSARSVAARSAGLSAAARRRVSDRSRSPVVSTAPVLRAARVLVAEATRARMSASVSVVHPVCRQ